VSNKKKTLHHAKQQKMPLGSGSTWLCYKVHATSNSICPSTTLANGLCQNCKQTYQQNMQAVDSKL